MDPITLGGLTALAKIFALATAASTVVVAACWVVEQFISNAKVKARVRGVRKFFVKVMKISWKLVKMVAELMDVYGTVIDSETRSSTEFSSEYRNALDQGPIRHEVYA